MNTEELNRKLNEESVLLQAPPGAGNGNWTGAPGVFFDETSDAFYLTYRIRRPRGSELDRGGETRIARSSDGRRFEDIFSLKKTEIGSPSIERCALVRGADGKWQYFLSYVDPADRRWRLSKILSDRPDRFDAAQLAEVFSPGDLGLEAVKDPRFFQWRGRWHLFLSVAVATDETSAESHATADIYNTGQCLTGTALATGEDLDSLAWKGPVFLATGEGWDGYTRRITGVTAVENGFLAFYDGIASHRENYEEKAGVAFSPDLATWQSLTPEGPVFTSANGSGSLRYIDIVHARGRYFLYFETACADGSHELRSLESDVLPSID